MPHFDENDNRLFMGVLNGNLGAVKAALEAGSSINGPPQHAFTPIVAATMAGRIGIANFLLEQGADPDRPSTVEVPWPTGDICKFMRGERPHHIAARGGNVEIVRLLLKRSSADPNAADDGGYTPLMAACFCQHAYMEVVRLLLEAGADPALANAKTGFTPIHVGACRGYTDLIDIMHSRAPATLNRCATEGETPLLMACLEGHESSVSKLLALGAMQSVPLEGIVKYPLEAAVGKGFVGIVRILMNEGGTRAVGGEEALEKALSAAIVFRRATIFRLLLGVDGEERRSKWASSVGLLHFAASYYPAAVSILLEAGADEATCVGEGCIPRDDVGLDLGQDDSPQVDQGEEVAVRRMLQRGPAYRARSWAWPSYEEDASGSGDGDTAAAAAAAAAVFASPPAQTTKEIHVRMFLPKKNSSSKCFTRLVGRYCEKV